MRGLSTYHACETRTHIDSIILARNVSHLTDCTIDRGMEAVIILGREPEDGQRTTGVLVCFIFVSIPQKSCNGEFAALYPKFRGFGDALESHEATVGSTHDAVWVIWTFDWAGRGLEFSKKEWSAFEDDRSGLIKTYR